MICETCGKEHDGSYGSGRFCCLACANTRHPSESTKKKMSNSLKQRYKALPSKTYTYICENCGEQFVLTYRIKKGRHIHCDKCKQHRDKFKSAPNTIYDVSSRTMSLILQRANIGCSICGWNETSGDIHHIIERKNNGTNELNNLIYVCPNCHRIIHKTNKYSIEYLQTKSLDKILPNWKDYYNIK